MSMIVWLARILLMGYAVVLPIRGTAALQATLLLTAFTALLWERRRELAAAWIEARWLLGPLLMFSFWVFAVCGFWPDLPSYSWADPSQRPQQPWFSLNLWRRDIAQPMLALLCGYWAFRDAVSRHWLFTVQIILLAVLLAFAVNQFYIGEEIIRGPRLPDTNYWVKGTLFVRGLSRDNIFFSYVLLLLTPAVFWMVVQQIFLHTQNDSLKNPVNSVNPVKESDLPRPLLVKEGRIFKTGSKIGWQGWFYLAALGVLFYLIFLNKSRGTWMALYIELILISAWMGRRVLIFFILGTTLMGVTAYKARPHWFQREYDANSTSRVEIYKKIPLLLLKRPFTGVGFGKDTVVKNYWHMIYQHAHNTFINMVLGVGFPGLALWLCALAVYGRRFWRARMQGWSVRIGLALLVGFCVRNFVDDIWLSSNAELFWFLIGVLMPTKP